MIHSGYATEKMYGVVGVGYSSLTFNQQDISGINYKLALGHEISRHWYVEAGMYQLVDDVNDASGGKADSLYLAVLGKAGNRTGELFYKLGVMNVDVQGIDAAASDGSCTLGDPLGESGLCAFDEGVLAGLAGIGFDYHLGLSSMLRIEVEYMKGKHDFSDAAVNVGFRYNFN